MKLSFSIKGWNCRDFDEYISTAKEYGFKGIELTDLANTGFADNGGAFDKYNSSATSKKLYEAGLALPCMDSACDISSDDVDAMKKELEFCMSIAKTMKIPYIRVYAKDADTTVEKAIANMEKLLPMVEDEVIVLAVETMGVFSNTDNLKELLGYFASDSVGALWDVYHTCMVAGEKAEKSIQNLGASVKHVHMKDAMHVGNELEYTLMGEGELPFNEVMNALRSVNYDGFMSLEWDPSWMEEIGEPDIIFPQFAEYLKSFGSPDKNQKPCFYNETGTGKYVWKKDIVIEKTFSQVLDEMVDRFPDQYCFKYTTLDYTRTYSEFRDDVDNVARALVSMGVKAGSHVAIWTTNIPQWYLTFWATVKIGAVLVTVNTAYKIHEIEYLLKQSDTHTLVMIDEFKDSNYKDAIQRLCPELEHTVPGKPLHCKKLPMLRNVITVGFKMPGCLEWNEAMQRSVDVPVEKIHKMAAEVDIHDVCNMQYTSGTTGFPKGVMLTHYNVVNNGKYIGDHMDLSTADRMMIQVPMFHCFGMVLSMTSSMTHGATMCPMPYFSPKSSLACINQEHITAFNGVPTMFIAMMQHADFDKTDFSYMRVGIMAGANCPADLMKLAATGPMNMKQIVSVYGQTEASPGCTMSSYYDDLTVRTETVGSAFANVECKVIDPETGEDVPDGVNGEFVARGYNIMKGYYKMPEATAAAIDENGWLHSGDLACRDENGNYRITGRLKDMIIRGGENIYPKEIEEFIYTCPKVRDVQVIGVPDEQYGEEIMACIILKDGEEMTEKEMKDFIMASLAKHKVPRYVDFVKEFPMNAAGKILKYKMREEAAERLGLNKK